MGKSLKDNIFLIIKQFLLFILTINVLFAQDTLQQTILEIPVIAKAVDVDQLGNIYALTPENDLIKYSEKGDLLFEYNENGLGDLGSFQTQNPLELVLYYPDYQVVRVLDRTLSALQTIDLTRLSIFQIPVVSIASDGNIWLFDSDHQEIIKIDRKGKVLIQSQDLRMRLQQNITPNKLMESNKKLYLNDPKIGIVQFDLFGRFECVYNIKDLTDFTIHNNQIHYISPNQSTEIKQYYERIGMDKIYIMPFSVIDFDRYQQYWLLLDEQGIYLLR